MKKKHLIFGKHTIRRLSGDALAAVHGRGVLQQIASIDCPTQGMSCGNPDPLSLDGGCDPTNI